MLNQQPHEFRELFTQELANARTGAPMIKKPIVVEQVNNGPIPSHYTTVKEGNNYDSESYQGLK